MMMMIMIMIIIIINNDNKFYSSLKLYVIIIYSTKLFTITLLIKSRQNVVNRHE